jgi:hypothetical protein
LKTFDIFVRWDCELHAFTQHGGQSTYVSWKICYWRVCKKISCTVSVVRRKHIQNSGKILNHSSLLDKHKIWKLVVYCIVQPTRCTFMNFILITSSKFYCTCSLWYVSRIHVDLLLPRLKWNWFLVTSLLGYQNKIHESTSVWFYCTIYHDARSV